MKPPALPDKINPHEWDKFERAQKNMMRFFRGGKRVKLRTLRKWGREVTRTMERIMR